MDTAQRSRLTPATLAFIASGLTQLGVVGNENGGHFEVQDATDEALLGLLKAAGYQGGTLEPAVLDAPHDGVDVLIYDTGRYADRTEAEQAWERDYHKRSRDRVSCLVEDWLVRLDDLRMQMDSWLKASDLSGLTIFDLPRASMLEQPMRRFGVPAREMPVFEIRSEAQRVLRFQPRGLWVIGANGRVDLITRKAAPILFDRAKPLARPTDWQLFDSHRSIGSVPLTQDVLLDLVRAGLR
jgi:hypothetical protein